MTTSLGSHHQTPSAATHAPPPIVSPLQQSRVGRDTQRYDADRRLLACSVIVRQRTAGEREREVLLISSSKHPGAWILPKGGWEQDETIDQCALREAEEEAGVAGVIVQSLGECDFATGKGKPCRLYGFQLAPVQQYDVWAEQSRQRQWVRGKILPRPMTNCPTNWRGFASLKMSFPAARDLLASRPELATMLSRVEDRESPRASDSEYA